MKKFLLFFLFSTGCYSQNVQELISSLKGELKTNPDPKRTATIYSDLTWYYSNVSIDSALSYGSKAIRESELLKDSVLIAQVYSDVGAVYFRRGDFNDSKKNYLRAYAIRKKRNDEMGMAKININLASIYVKRQEYQPALKSYLEAIQYFEAKGNPAIVAETKANVGLLFYEMKNYKKSVRYLKEAIPFQLTNNQEEKLANSYLSLGNNYLALKDTTAALSYFSKSMRLAKKNGNKLTLSSAYNNIGAIRTDQKKSREASALYAKSMSVRQDLNSDLEKAGLNINIAKELLLNRKFGEARQLLLNIKRVFEQKKSKDNLLITYNQLVSVYIGLGNPDSSSYYYDQYKNLNNELFEENLVRQTNELETKYQTAKKEKLLLEKEAQNKRKNTWILGISLLAFFTAAIGYLIYRQQKLKNKQQQQEFQLKSAIAQIETQNQLQEQRLSISRDLHDNIGAQLTFVISSVDNLKFGNKITDNKITSQLTKISDFTKSTIVELRDTIWAMNTSEFTFEDLHSRILNFIEKAQSAKEDVNFVFDVDESLKDQKFSSIIGINLYRTMQEAVNNAVKYADASQISVKVSGLKASIRIQISDNGKGFDIDTAELGNGLHNMKKRIEEVGGKWTLKSAPGKGTDVQILLTKTHTA